MEETLYHIKINGEEKQYKKGRHTKRLQRSTSPSLQTTLCWCCSITGCGNCAAG